MRLACVDPNALWESQGRDARRGQVGLEARHMQSLKAPSPSRYRVRPLSKAEMTDASVFPLANRELDSTAAEFELGGHSESCLERGVLEGPVAERIFR